MIARRPPWWLVLAAGAGCTVLGGLLTADPFRSLTVLVWVAGLAFAATGVAELLAAPEAASPAAARLVAPATCP